MIDFEKKEDSVYEEERQKGSNGKILFLIGSILLLILIYSVSYLIFDKEPEKEPEITAKSSAPVKEKKYEGTVLKELSKKYHEKFIVVDTDKKLDKKKKILVVAPIWNKELTFYAKATKYEGLFDEDKELELEDNYYFRSYLYYVPEIYGENLGIEIDEEKLNKEYESFLSENGWDYANFDTEAVFLNHPVLLISDINKDNVKDKAHDISNILFDYTKKAPFKKFRTMFKKDNYLDIGVFNLKIPIEFSGKPVDSTSSFGIPESIHIWDVIHYKNPEENINNYLMVNFKKTDERTWLTEK